MRLPLSLFFALTVGLMHSPLSAEEGIETLEPSPKPDATEIVGVEQSVKGTYHARCLRSASTDVCWLRITEQAKQNIRTKLLQNYNNVASITLVYSDFEGFQRNTQEDSRLLVEADGTFYFDVVESNQVSTVTVTRLSDQPLPPSQEENEDRADRGINNNELDVSLFYVWDNNNSATEDALALSSQRYGIGLWSQNRLGFVAFQGTDTLGIAKSNGDVVNAKASYDTTGIGVGFRLWANRSITLENHIYYVDAQPLTTSLNTVCDTCTDRVFDSQNYLQATVNLKTNSKGINVGWMLTWKWLEETPNLDRVSGGFYLEALF